jgi:ParB family chromosome partitioning protein
MRLEIETLALSTITPYWRNPRVSDKAVEAVKQSIQDYGFINPIILDKDHVIVAGHTRYRALMSLKVKQAACIVTDLTPDKVKAYRIADNKTSELTEWDMKLLIPELRELHDLPRMSIYFPEMNIVDFVEDLAMPQSLTDDTMPETITQEAIDKKTEEAQHQFQSAPKKVLLDVSCPHCQQSFSFDPAYFMSKQG